MFLLNLQWGLICCSTWRDIVCVWSCLAGGSPEDWDACFFIQKLTVCGQKQSLCDMVNILCWWLAEGYKIEFVPFFSLVFVRTCDSLLLSWDCGTSYFHCADFFLTFPCFPHHLSPAGALPALGSPSNTWGATLGRSPNLLVWGPLQRPTEPSEAATHPCALLYPVSEGTHRWPLGLRALGSVLLPVAYLQRSVLLAYPLKKEDSPRLPVQVSLHCSWPVSFRHLLCWWRRCYFQNGVAASPSHTETGLLQISNLKSIPFSHFCAFGLQDQRGRAVYRGCVGVNHAFTESHKGHVIQWGHFFIPATSLWHLWGCNDTGWWWKTGWEDRFLL